VCKPTGSATVTSDWYQILTQMTPSVESWISTVMCAEGLAGGHLSGYLDVKITDPMPDS
jgi:hypothetical protein